MSLGIHLNDLKQDGMKKIWTFELEIKRTLVMFSDELEQNVHIGLNTTKLLYI